MASRLWAYGKRLTLWGALVYSLPILFFPLMFFSVLGIAVSVPLGCSFAIYICFRNFFCALFKEVEVHQGLGVKESEAIGVSDVQEIESQEDKFPFEERTIHEDNARPLGKETHEVKGYGDETEAELDPCAISSGEEEQTHKGLNLNQALKSEGEAPLIEKLDPYKEAPEEAQAEVREKSVPIEEAPEDEAQNGDAREAQLEEKWDTDEEADTLKWAAQKEQLDPLEEQAPEVENHRDEVGEDQLKENWDTHEEEEEPLHALQWEAQKEQLNPLEEQAPEVETHKDEVGEAQLKEKRDTIEEEVVLQGEREAERGEEVKDQEEVSKGGVQSKWEQQEEWGNNRLAGPQEEENARQDQAAEVQTQYRPNKEVEVGVKVDSFEGEAQSDHNHGRTGEKIGTKHKRIEVQDESNGKLYATDTNHKIIREEEDKEQDESNGVQEIPHKRSRHERSLDLAPSILYTEITSREANVATPEPTPYSGQQSILAKSPHGASNLGVENAEPIEDNVAAGLPISSSSEMLVSSASEADRDSKPLSEGVVKEDTEDAEHIWEEIHALRNIIGYKEDPQLLYAEEIKALYVFTGIEPPACLKCSSDLDRAKEKLMLLKLVYGIK